MHVWPILLLLVAPALLHGQAPEQKPLAFEVAAISQNQSGQSGFSYGIRGSQYRIVNMPLRSIIGEAYEIGLTDERYRLVGGPDSLLSSRFDIVAKLPDGALRKDVPVMLRLLLAQRFGLEVHSEQRKSPVYVLRALAANRLGPYMHASKHDCDAFITAGRKVTDSNASADAEGRLLCVSRSQPGTIQLRYAGPVSRLVKSLQAHVDRPVRDESHLDGNYEWQLQFATPSGDNSPVSGIFTAVREQLGLKLEPHDQSTDMFVIDHIERPTPD